jgi:uncharacterized protein
MERRRRAGVGLSDFRDEKIKALSDKIKSYQSVVVAFSGGVDSTFLLLLAMRELGGKVVAATVDSVLMPRREVAEAEELASLLGCSHVILPAEPLKLREVRENSPERCYYCKRYLFGVLCDFARKEGYLAVLDGSNKDDEIDYRPGRKAALELGIQSPLLEVGITKAEIRQYSRKAGLPNWDRPAAACLASRIPYGEEITEDKVRMIEEAEAYLSSLGCSPVRVRWHQGVGRIETSLDHFPAVLEHRRKIADHLKALGFRYVSLDLMGYRRGSLNEVL